VYINYPVTRSVCSWW